MTTKIQINSLEALERLIGGDTELEFEIRRNIVEDFAKKHLRSLVNTELMAAIEVSIKESLKDTCLIKTNIRNEPFKLNSEFDKIIKDRISAAAPLIIGDVVTEKLNATDYFNQIDQRIKSVLESISNSLTEESINKRIDLAVAKIVKEKLSR